jgi:hypothetical protein
MPFQHIDGSAILDGILAATRIAGVGNRPLIRMQLDRPVVVTDLKKSLPLGPEVTGTKRRDPEL